MKKIHHLLLPTLVILAASCAIARPVPVPTYEPHWESLKRHETPEWFLDAKFGIYTHWGPVTVGAEDGPGGVQWYGRNMYAADSPTFKYHRRRFGDQNQFGYKDIIPLFKAEKFDAGQWAALFAEAGAKFAGPVAIHHDNFAMWDSAVTEWDSSDKGPGRDITAELKKAIRSHGMKFIATFHHGFAWRYFEPAYQYDAADPKYAGLYCQPHKPGAPPSKEFLDKWLAMVNEVVRKYEPELIWFDFGLGSVITPQHQQRMFADYYNWASRKGLQVGVAHKHRDIHGHTGILDFERGREDRLTPYAWLTDTSIGPWFHQKSVRFKSVDGIVDVLVDIVSKNGCMLLNVGPAADGTIPEGAQKILRGIGAWLKVNGQAIYDTRPWRVFGEGPTLNAGGGFSENKDKPYTARDIRFTRSKDGKTLYAIALDKPEKELTIQSMQIDRLAPGASVRLLGHEGTVRYRLNDAGQLVIEMPALDADRQSCRHAFAFKLSGFEISLSEHALFSRPDAVTLTAEKAVLFGGKIKLQEYAGRMNIGFWDRPEDSIHWLLAINRPGEYLLRGEFSAAYASTRLLVECADRKIEANIPKTNNWATTEFVRFDRLKFDKPGVYQIALRAADPDNWKAANVYQLQLAVHEP
ncbi:MAG: alpha-L-fucosidase [Phycisphaerales bacterium]|nr:MAG: alpha-L-fucosidase [Phycisphaerales bacterium]